MSPYNPQAFVRPFGSALANALQSLRELPPLLDEERRALSGQDPDRLGDVVGRKLEALAALELRMRECDSLLSRAGFADGFRGAEELLQRYPHPQSLDDCWRELKALAADVDRMNAINGSVAGQVHQHTRQALAILTGREAATASYDRHGRSGEPLDGYSLGKA